MTDLIYSPPGIIKKLLSDYIWTTSNDVLLTFDDGPNPETTELILKFLKNNNISALFFCVGNNIRKYPELAKQILDEGHIIGNHTMNHKIVTFRSAKSIDQDINDFQQLCKSELEFTPTYFRPPRGRIRVNLKHILEKHNLTNMMWSVLTGDYNGDFSLVKYTIDKYLDKNSIITLHDSNKSKSIIIDSLKYICDQTEKKGFSFQKASACLK